MRSLALRSLVSLLLLTLVDAPARAASPAWRWEMGSPRAYAFDLCLELPEPMPLTAEPALSTRVDRVQLGLRTRCEAATVEPGAWTLVCSLDQVQLQAEALPGEEAALGAVLGALDSRLTGALVEMQMRRNGRISTPILHTDERRGRKLSREQDPLPLLLERAFLGLELSLPEGDTTRWGESAPGQMTYLMRDRSSGAARLQHVAQPREDGTRWDVQSRGRAVIQADALTRAAGRGQPAALSLNMVMVSVASVNLAEGELEERRWALYSRVTPSSAFDASLIRHPYAVLGELKRDRGGLLPLGESGPFTADPTTRACVRLDVGRETMEAELDQPLSAP